MSDNFLDSISNGESYLKHHGVLGQKWGKRKAKPPSRRQLIDAAVKKKYSNAKTAVRDDRSAKTIKRGRAALTTGLAGIGTLAIGSLAKDPRVQAGAFVTSTILAGVSIGNSIAENHSAQNDLLKKYGK